MLLHKVAEHNTWQDQALRWKTAGYDVDPNKPPALELREAKRVSPPLRSVPIQEKGAAIPWMEEAFLGSK